VIGLDPLAPEDAAELLRLRVAGHGGDAALTAHDAGVARLCELTGGLPLGVELAAARLRTMPLQALIDRITIRPDLLSSQGRPGLAHQRGLLTTLRWSYDLLTRPGQMLLTRLAVFAGSFSLEDAEKICGYSPLAASDVAGLLSGLVDDSLVQITNDDDRHGYRLLIPIRDFAVGQAPDDDLNATRARHLRRLCAGAELIDSAAEEQRRLITERLRDRYPEIQAALEWAQSDEAPGPDMEHGCQAAADGTVGVGTPSRRHPHRPQDLTLLTGDLCSRAGDFDAVKPLLEQARRLLDDRNAHDRDRRAAALSFLAAIAYVRIQPEAADLIRQFADDARKTGDRQTIVFRLSVAAGMLAVLGHADEALALIQEAGTATGSHRALRQRFLPRRSYVYLRLDRPAEAMNDAEEVLADQSGVTSSELIESMLNRGWALTRQGHHDAARSALDESMRLGRELQVLALLPDISQALAVTETAAGNLPHAIRHVREILQWALPRSDAIDIMGALHLAVVLAAKTSQPHAAQLASAVRSCRLRGGLSPWPFTVSAYAPVETQLGVSTETLPAGPPLLDAVISAGELALRHLTAFSASKGTPTAPAIDDPRAGAHKRAGPLSARHSRSRYRQCQRRDR
jgi:tetratricopeptide (TPR) repeat protein